MTPREPIVSVIVCFLNEQRFLAEAVHSVVGQTFADWELLLVDDGSTDGSSAIARQLAATDPRFDYIEHAGHRNLGLSASRNAGIERARGRYIAFLDADDAWYPRKLDEQVAILERHPQAAMVIGASNYWRSWSGQPDSSDEIIPIGAGPQDTVIAPPLLMTSLYPLGTGAAPPPSDLLLRRDVVQAVSGFEASFRGPLMLYEDQAFLSKVYRSYPVYVASACWDRYRQRADSIVATNNAAGRYWQIRSHFLQWLRRDLVRTGGTPPAVRSALGRAIRQARIKLARAWLARAAQRVLPAPLYARLRPRRAGP